MPKSDLCEYSDAFIIVKWTIDLEVAGNNGMTRKGIEFKNNALFRSCILKINKTFIDNAEDLDIIVPLYNL